MNFHYIKEPRLVFGDGNKHVCARKGIATYGVYDKLSQSRKKEIMLGVVGTAEDLEAFSALIERIKSPIISEKPDLKKNLFPDFCGFNDSVGFYSNLVFNDELARKLSNADIAAVLKNTDRNQLVEAAINLYYEEVKFLSQNRPIDIVVCILPKKIYDQVSKDTLTEVSEDELPVVETVSGELNFRRALKARCMHFAKPLQLIKGESLKEGVSGQQNDATKAWNLSSALYYKAGARNPWRLDADATKPQSCALGVAFYRSRDKQTLNTSLAQVFDELGNGLILRGTPVSLEKDDRTPRLTANQSYELFVSALSEYRNALKIFPARVVIHKSSNFSDEEIAGLESAASDLRIDSVDFVTVMDSKLRLFRSGNYPPYRGSMMSINEQRHLLYTRGSVYYYRTYPGMYIPQPLDLRIVKSEQSPAFIAKEILGLSKMNWNNTQFDGKYPITLSCARKVGEIMKYLEESDKPQIRYGYYM